MKMLCGHVLTPFASDADTRTIVAVPMAVSVRISAVIAVARTVVAAIAVMAIAVMAAPTAVRAQVSRLSVREPILPLGCVRRQRKACCSRERESRDTDKNLRHAFSSIRRS